MAGLRELSTLSDTRTAISDYSFLLLDNAPCSQSGL